MTARENGRNKILMDDKENTGTTHKDGLIYKFHLSFKLFKIYLLSILNE